MAKVGYLYLAATELGLGTCWVCNFNSSLCRQTFSIPENESPAVLIPLGHPSQDAEHKAKNRKSTDEIVTIL